MNIDSVELIYFSPTGTTKKVTESIAHGLRVATIKPVDLTLPENIPQNPVRICDGLAIIGSPVYGGRLPAHAVARLRRLKGNNTPAVVIVVYGNRAYEDALLELRDLACDLGFRPFAAGAFIGEHSYSTDAAPIAVGRPDTEDIRKAELFGNTIRQKIEKTLTLIGMFQLEVPGNFPYKELRMLSDVSPATHEQVCAKCGQCASVCPTSAITISDTVATNPGACIRCCACVKTCSTGARVMEDPRIRNVAAQLSTNCRMRKEPEIYI